MSKSLRQRRRSRRARRQIRRGGAALLFDERHRHRLRRGFSEERIGRYNTDLANSLGNLLNRSLNMATRYSAGSLRRGNGPATQDFQMLVQAYRDLAQDVAMSRIDRYGDQNRDRG